ncbi:MAG: FAD-binding protein, partial [Balneolaceae bacterium]
MSTLLTFISTNNGKIKRSSLEVLSKCNELAELNGLSSSALVIDENPNACLDELKKYGPSTIYTVKDPIFKNHLNTPLLRACSLAVEKISPRLIAFASTESSKDILGALAAGLEAAAIADMSEFELTDIGVKGKRPVMASKIISAVEAKGTPCVISVRSGSYDDREKETDTKVEEIPFSFNEKELKITLKEIIGSSSDKIDLSEAETVVAAGRGVKDEEGRNLITELSSVLNAGIGASRALTEAGVYDPSLQIGQ